VFSGFGFVAGRGLVLALGGSFAFFLLLLVGCPSLYYLFFCSVCPVWVLLVPSSWLNKICYLKKKKYYCVLLFVLGLFTFIISISFNLVTWLICSTH
jgi:carbon starvation protein CstA